MTHHPVVETIANCGVVPVIAIESAEGAIALADALLEGGLPIVEITFRTTAAAAVIAELTAKRPALCVGAGTVLSLKNLEAAYACGARFGVAPGLNPTIVQQANKLGMPFIPGVATPTEIEQALELGCTLLKVFPAETLGGVGLIKALAGPYAHTGVRFVPTGGVNLGNLAAYLQQKTVAAVGGTWIAKPDDLAAGKWTEIRDRCREAVDLVKRLREER